MSQTLIFHVSVFQLYPFRADCVKNLNINPWLIYICARPFPVPECAVTIHELDAIKDPFVPFFYEGIGVCSVRELFAFSELSSSEDPLCTVSDFSPLP